MVARRRWRRAPEGETGPGHLHAGARVARASVLFPGITPTFSAWPTLAAAQTRRRVALAQNSRMASPEEGVRRSGIQQRKIEQVHNRFASGIIPPAQAYTHAAFCLR